MSVTQITHLGMASAFALPAAGHRFFPSAAQPISPRRLQHSRPALPTTLPVASPSVVWTPLPDGAVLFSTETEVYYGVNGVGALMWELLPPASRTLEDLCAAVHAKYPDASLEQIQTDVVELLEDLKRCGLVQTPDAS